MRSFIPAQTKELAFFFFFRSELLRQKATDAGAKPKARVRDENENENEAAAAAAESDLGRLAYGKDRPIRIADTRMFTYSAFL